jgi:hypothetical protein
VFLIASQNKQLRDLFYFYHLEEPNCAETLYNVTSTPAYVLLRAFDESPIIFYPEKGLPEDW